MRMSKDAKREVGAAALAAWAERVAEARWRFVADLVDHAKSAVIVADLDDYLDADAQTAQELVSWIASVFAGGRQVQQLEREILRRLAAGAQPVGSGNKAILAEKLVKEHAERYRDSLEPGYRGNSPNEIANQLVCDLWSTVHVGFGQLFAAMPELEELLTRYRWKKRARRLGSEALLVEINRLASKPLGTFSFSRDSVKSAKRRSNKPK
jgi:O-methyltransferase involved in polyketide biosynthesis